MLQSIGSRRTRQDLETEQRKVMRGGSDQKLKNAKLLFVSFAGDGDGGRGTGEGKLRGVGDGALS